MSASAVSPPIDTQIQQLIDENRVVLFMKGTAEQPLCGFSMGVVQILNVHETPFRVVNVLADEGLREGIKVFSDWPTIPQLYVDGKFVGGFDIVREMHEEDELTPLLAS